MRARPRSMKSNGWSGKKISSANFLACPGYLHAPVSGGKTDERPNLKKDAKLANEFGFNAAYLDRVPFMNTPGVRFGDQAKFHPLKFLFALAQKIHGNGVRIFENSAVTKFDSKKKRAKANGHWINYDRVVLATNNPLLGRIGPDQRNAFPNQALALFLLCRRRDDSARLDPDRLFLGHE